MWSPEMQEDLFRNKKYCELFKRKINKKFALKLNSYNDIYRWSIEDIRRFWKEFLQFMQIDFIRDNMKNEEILENYEKMSNLPKWFPNSRMNYAQQLLKWSLNEKEQWNEVFSYSHREGQPIGSLRKKTWKNLHDDVARYSAAFRKYGVKNGDRIAGYVPNSYRTLVAMLAANSCGALWTAAGPDFGAKSVLDRFGQIRPIILFTVNAVVYNGKIHKQFEKVKEIVNELESVEKLIVYNYVEEVGLDEFRSIKNCCSREEFLGEFVETIPKLEFDQLPFNHPLYVMYSSGTTGKPKCLIHGQGGTFVQHLKEHSLHSNITSDDTMMYYTSPGWMMWHWSVSAIALGCKLVFYDGSPLDLNGNILFDLIDRCDVSIFGTGAKFICMIEQKGINPSASHQLTHLRTILSTGSTLPPTSYDYVYEKFKKNLLLGSVTGGTDIISYFAGDNVDLPVRRGEIQAANLGMAIECWPDEINQGRGDESHHLLGERGELVCVQPFPCMPLYFWEDDKNKRYLHSYFEKFEKQGIWAHGDFCRFEKETNGIYMLGRSDGTLNPNGVRFGSAEIYNVLEQVTEVTDSVCVPLRSMTAEDEVVVLFVQLKEKELEDELMKKIKSQIRIHLSPRHVPWKVLQCHSIPYTNNGKKVEIVVREAINGRDFSIRSVANPESIEEFVKLRKQLI
ncbi:hypothetical protein SNEBB_000046 [Seison nebaliae]|nr:hypothetical protein SNEBB_000046 [Seison nebaliae]